MARSFTMGATSAPNTRARKRPMPKRAKAGRRARIAVSPPATPMAAPDAIGVAGGDTAMRALLPAFARFGIGRFRARVFGADVAPIVKDRAIAYNLQPDARHYFDIHHTEADTLDKVRPEDLRRNAAAIALLAYVLGER